MSPKPAAPSTNRIVLATSLVPLRDHALQAAAVASWRAAGFAVISVNGAKEADQVRGEFPEVTVVTAERTTEQFAKKPVPYIHDLLAALRSACAGKSLGDCTVGIINADIYLRPLPDLAPVIRREAKGALLLGPRVDVAARADFETFAPSGAETYSIGYDYFLMSGDLLDDFAESPFCMGMPFWDYWMPLVALLKGRPLKTVTTPVALGSRKASGSERLGRLQVAGWMADGLGRRACGIEATCRRWSASAPALCAHVCVCVCMAARATAVCRWEGP